jgi:hypothetical protein
MANYLKDNYQIITINKLRNLRRRKNKISFVFAGTRETEEEIGRNGPSSWLEHTPQLYW